MRKVLKILLICVLLAVGVMVILNPSIKKFKDFSYELEAGEKKVVYRKVSNFFIYSIYEKKIFEVDEYGYITEKYSEKYIGFMGNFWRDNDY